MSKEDYQKFKQKKKDVVLAGDGTVETFTKDMRHIQDCQVQKAKQTRELQDMLVYLSDRELKNIIRGNVLKNYDVTIDDITTAFKVSGPSTASLKGKSTKKIDNEVVMDQVPVPRSVLRDHKKLT
eukprot:15337896-Ditylum_brightwellii.AAC.1